MGLSVAELKVLFGVDTSAVARGEKDILASARRTGAAYDQASNRMTRSTGTFANGMRRHFSLLAGGVGLGAVVKSSIDLEQSYSKTMRLAAAATGAPQREIKKLDALVMNLGASTQYSSNEVAGALLDMSKAGVSTQDIFGGGLKYALQLASAGGLDLGTATTIASNAMNTFNLRGDQMAQISAALAGGANASTASVESLGMGLSQVGPGARNAGLSLQQTVGVLSAFDAAGIKGSDAGTSLKTMLVNLVPQTKQAREEMKRLGLDFTDSEGNFVSIRDVAQQLHDKLGPLTEAQRAQALTTLFGSDATRAATVLMHEGSEGLGKYIKATRDQSAAQKMSNAAMDGTSGALERMHGSIETTELALGKALAPTVVDFANKVSTKGAPAVTKFIGEMQSGHGAGGQLADTLHQVAEAGKDVAQVGGHVLSWVNGLPGPVKKLSAEALIAYGVVKKLSSVTGLLKSNGSMSLGKLAASTALGGAGRGVVPVYVTNSGFSLPGGTPGKPGVTPAVAPTSKGSRITGGDLVALVAAAIGGTALNHLSNNAPKNPKSSPFSMFDKDGSFWRRGVFGTDHTLTSDVRTAQGARTASGPGKLYNSITQHGAGLFGQDNTTTTAIKHVAELDAKLAHLAKTKPDKAIAGFQKVLDATGMSAKELNKLLPKTDAAMHPGKPVAFISDLAKGVNAAGKSAASYAKVWKSIPKELRTYVTTPGQKISMDGMRNLQKVYNLNPKQLRTIMQLQGYSQTQQQVILAGKRFNNLPKAVRTAITAGGVVKTVADVSRLVRTYNLTPRQKKTVMQVSGVTAALAQVRALQVAIAKVRSKSVSITVVRNRDQGGVQIATPHATGGPVTGPGGPRDDRVLIAASNGEYVVNAAAYKRNRGLVNAINSGQLNRYAGAFASGGPVGSKLEILQAQASVRDLDAQIAAANSKKASGSHLEVLQAAQSIRDIDRQLRERKKKTVKGKGKHGKSHEVDDGLAATGIDRQVLWGQRAEAVAELSRLKRATTTPALDKNILLAQRSEAAAELARLQAAAPAEEEDTSARDSFRSQLLGNIFGTGTTSATQLAKNLATQQATNNQWLSLLAGLSNAHASQSIIDQFKNNGPSAQALALGQSILKTGNVGQLNSEYATTEAQGAAYGDYATGKTTTPTSGPLVKIENFNAQGQSPDEIGERLYFVSRIRR